MVYSPWLFLRWWSRITPAFLGESHFAFLGYSLAHSLTPVRRELDYLRVLATSKESAKEVKIFGLAALSARPLRDRTDGLIERNRLLARKRLWGGRSSPWSVRSATTAAIRLPGDPSAGRAA